MPERSQRVKTRHAVGSVAEFVAGTARLVDVAGRSIGIFRVHDQIIAVLNLCPHAGAPLGRGQVRGTTLQRQANHQQRILQGVCSKAPEEVQQRADA